MDRTLSLRKPCVAVFFATDLILHDDIIDVNIDGKRCIVNRTVEQKGGYFWLYAKHGQVKFKNVKVSPIISG